MHRWFIIFLTAVSLSVGCCALVSTGSLEHHLNYMVMARNTSGFLSHGFTATVGGGRLFLSANELVQPRGEYVSQPAMNQSSWVFGDIVVSTRSGSRGWAGGSASDFRAITLQSRFLFAISLAVGGYPTLRLVRYIEVRRQRRRNGLCIRCGYDLTGNESGACPECRADCVARRTA